MRVKALGSAVICCATLTACVRAGGNGMLPSGSPESGLPNSPAWSSGYSQIYSFEGKGTGADPQAQLLPLNGRLYGTTSSGGLGFGAVFSMTLSGHVHPLYQFKGGSSDGAYPAASLVEFNGMLYGTTPVGGTYGNGTVFAMSIGGAEHVVYSFGRTRHDGVDPESQLVAVHGVLYGTTYLGGSRGRGTVFSVTPGGRERVLHSFIGGPTDGGHPSAGLTYANGLFYGVTRAGGVVKSGGAAFSIDTSGHEQLIHSFGDDPGDGSNPAGTLLFAYGDLYGTTLHGGNYGGGIFFKMDPTGYTTKLYNFGHRFHGSNPAAGVVRADRAFWGTTEGSGRGTVWRYGGGVGYHVVYYFYGRKDGSDPEAALVNVHGELYGTTFAGGSSNAGTIFKLRD